jgi:hypothetical protein
MWTCRPPIPRRTSWHCNSIRVLIKYLDDIPDDEIAGITIPTGFPLVYELDETKNPVRHYYLADLAAIRKERKRERERIIFTMTERSL